MTPVSFLLPNGNTTAINPESVGAIQDDHHYPGGRYEPGCTVFLNSGEKIHLPTSAYDVIRKLYPSEPR